MQAADCGKLIIYIRSIMWDLGIPQAEETIVYEDNDAARHMANAQKPTTRTRHMDIKYHVLAEQVERDLIILERVNTTQNMADHFTKQLGPLIFKRNVDYLMGHVPPQYSPCFEHLHGMTRREKSAKKDSPAISSPILAQKMIASWTQVTRYYSARCR